MSACEPCIRRAWLVAAMAGNLELAWRSRKSPRDTLSLTDSELIDALGGPTRSALSERRDSLDTTLMLSVWERSGVTAVCRHDRRYPLRLGLLADSPAILFCAGDPELLSLVAGTVEDGPSAAAVVGTRRPLPEAEELARGLGRGLAGSGVAVVSGMAMGIDSAAHAGAVEVRGPTIAVLACGPEQAYPRSKAALHRRLIAEHLVIAELPPGCTPWRWAFPARNRIIAALGSVTIVVEAAERSGSLITADFAAAMGREVGVTPGRAGSPRTRGGNSLLREGAAVILDTSDALDLVLGPQRARLPAVGASLEPELANVLAAVAAGDDGVAALGVVAGGADQARVKLMELELLGLVRRMPGDRYVAVIT